MPPKMNPDAFLVDEVSGVVSADKMFKSKTKEVAASPPKEEQK